LGQGFLYCNIEADYKGDQLNNYCSLKGFEYDQSDLSIESFTFANKKELDIKKRIEKIGTPLKDWDIKINYGIKTGYNEAFIIDTETKERLCKEDPKSEEIIKPILRGRDIKRYSYEWAGLWIIGTFPALNLNIDDYPAIKKYLLSFGKRIEQTGEAGARKRTGNEWFETQDQIAYWQEFEKEKIVWNPVSGEYVFSLIKQEMYFNNSLFMITGGSLNYIISILNSNLNKWLIKQMTNLIETGKYAYGAKDKIELLPIPKISEEKQKPFIELVERILSLKEQNKDTTELEHKIDLMVCRLYGLSYEEVKIIDPEIEIKTSKAEYENVSV
jgi:adenine-specific DNA-methyltransferase